MVSASEAKASCVAAGVSQADLDTLATVGSIDWGKLFALVQQYGPQIIALILALFNKTPAPAPTPTPAPAQG